MRVADDVKRLKELERESSSLKRIVADKALEVDALKEMAKGTGEPGPEEASGGDALRPSRCYRDALASIQR